MWLEIKTTPSKTNIFLCIFRGNHFRHVATIVHWFIWINFLVAIDFNFKFSFRIVPFGLSYFWGVCVEEKCLLCIRFQQLNMRQIPGESLRLKWAKAGDNKNDNADEDIRLLNQFSFIHFTTSSKMPHFLFPFSF